MSTENETRILDLIPLSLHDKLKLEVLQQIEADKQAEAQRLKTNPTAEEKAMLDTIIGKF